MRRKINNNDIIRMVYESCRRVLNENDTQQDNEYDPIDFHPSFYKEKYYFNITFRDKRLFGALANFRTDMAGMAMRAAQRRNMPFSEDDFNRIKNMFGITSSNRRLDDDTKWVILKVEIKSPETLLDADGNPNPNSQDIKKILNLFKGLESKGISISTDEKRNALNTMFYYVANKANKDNEQQVDMEIKKLFFKICQTLGEEETKQLLRTIQITDGGFIADHQYSLHNKLRIIAQAMIYDEKGDNQVNTISYLATPRQWRKMGRMVTDFSHPYHTVTFNGGRGGQEKEIDFALQRGMKPITMNENNSNGIGFATGKGLNAAVNADMFGRKSFSYNDAVYDVQATEVIAGAKDKFTNEPGMKNNLTGELNDVAIQRIAGMPDISSKEEKDDRTKKLNDMFGTNDYESIDLTYQATCMASNETPHIANDADMEAKIKETGNLIDKMLIKRLSGFKDGEGHIARPENYLPLVPIGRIIIQAIIGLPMDDAPAIQWAQEHQQIANALSSHVHAISNKILRNKMSIKHGQDAGINEMIDNYSKMFIFEEWFDNAIKLLRENEEI